MTRSLGALLLAAVGVSAGAEWHVYPGAGVGETIYVHAVAYHENVDVWKRLTIEGAGSIMEAAA